VYATLTSLVDQLAGSTLLGTDVLRWGAPVPAFGDPAVSQVATLGLNPSNREFVDEQGRELMGTARRFHTLSSLELTRWDEADAQHLELVVRSCCDYFRRNPYDRWFRKLDGLITGMGTSYYAAGTAAQPSVANPACHLDLIPYATRCKWIDLTRQQRMRLLERSSDALGTLLRDGVINVLVLNGQSVVEYFETLIGSPLDRIEKREWTLPRQSGTPVRGVGFRGIVRVVGRARLGRDVLVLGYNHNIQSSFGVTNKVMIALRNWITVSSEGWIA
jgi:hypothetical protein